MKGDSMLKFVFGASVALFVFVAQPAFAEATKPLRLISISGHSEVRTAPDMAVVTIGTFSQAKTATAALDSNSKAIAALLAILKAEGIADKDMQTSNFSVSPRNDDRASSKEQLVVGYDVSNTLTITLRKISDLGRILDKAVTAGSNQINGVSFTVADPQPAMDEARKAAVKEALRKAELISSAAGVKLGMISQISEGGSSMPQPMQMREMAYSANKDVPIAAGEVVIGADVNVVWEIQ